MNHEDFDAHNARETFLTIPAIFAGFVRIKIFVIHGAVPQAPAVA
jgi:hypothetical protein